MRDYISKLADLVLRALTTCVYEAGRLKRLNRSQARPAEEADSFPDGKLSKSLPAVWARGMVSTG